MVEPEENFFKLLAFVSDFYIDLLQLPIQMGRASARGYQYFLGDIQSKRLRFEIAEGNKGNMRRDVLAFGGSELSYLKNIDMFK